MIGLEAHDKEELLLIVKEQEAVIKQMVERATNPPIMFQTNDEEFKRRANEKISNLKYEVISLEEEVKRLEQIILERELWRTK